MMREQLVRWFGAAALLVGVWSVANAQASIETSPRGIKPPADPRGVSTQDFTTGPGPNNDLIGEFGWVNRNLRRPQSRRSRPDDSIADKLNAQELDRILQGASGGPAVGYTAPAVSPSRVGAPAQIEIAPRGIRPPPVK